MLNTAFYPHLIPFAAPEPNRVVEKQRLVQVSSRPQRLCVPSRHCFKRTPFLHRANTPLSTTVFPARSSTSVSVENGRYATYTSLTVRTLGSYYALFAVGMASTAYGAFQLVRVSRSFPYALSERRPRSSLPFRGLVGQAFGVIALDGSSNIAFYYSTQ